MSEPWVDWIPGVLSDSQLKALCNEGKILDVSEPDRAIDYSSIDLTLDNECYMLPSGAVKPFGGNYLHSVTTKLGLAKKVTPVDNTYTLSARATYLFKLKERIPALGKCSIYGQATGKSSIGRLDVLTRLIVDGMDCYESFTPQGLAKGNGDMYLEVTPMTFPVEAQPGIPLTQLRLFWGQPEDSEIRSKELYASVLNNPTATECSLSIDLTPTLMGGHNIVAYCARQNSGHTPIRLWDKPGSHDPSKYWSLKTVEAHNRITIQKTDFYILRSLERMAVPSGIAIYCRANDETIGEMRIHYAGFIHPFFGTNRDDDEEGTPVIFEVRGHDVNVSMKHGEKMARLIFYRMSQDCSDTRKSSYNEQNLQLSKLFRAWPDEFEINGNGAAVAAPTEGRE